MSGFRAFCFSGAAMLALIGVISGGVVGIVDSALASAVLFIALTWKEAKS